MCLTNDTAYSIKALCSNCTHQSCCTGFDAAIVFPEDLVNLKKIGKVGPEFLEDTVIAGRKLKQIRKNSSHQCIFWNGKCEIYDFRPFDCKLFPFDIDKINDEFYWMVYSCNKDSDWKWTEEYLQRFENDPMLHKKMEHLAIFDEAPYLEGEKMPHTVLRKVIFK